MNTNTRMRSHTFSVFIIWKWSIVIDCSLLPRAIACWRCVENRILVACIDGVRICVTVSLRHAFQRVQSKRTRLSKVKALYRASSNSCALLAQAQAAWSLSFIRKSLSFSIPWLTACSRIWKWLWYHRYNFLKTFIFSCHTNLMCSWRHRPRNQIVWQPDFLFFPSFLLPFIAAIYLSFFSLVVKSNREGKSAGSPVAFPAQTNGNLIPLVRALIIVVFSTESCSGLLIDFRTHAFGVMKLVHGAWNLTPPLAWVCEIKIGPQYNATWFILYFS